MKKQAINVQHDKYKVVHDYRCCGAEEWSESCEHDTKDCVMNMVLQILSAQPEVTQSVP